MGASLPLTACATSIEPLGPHCYPVNASSSLTEMHSTEGICNLTLRWYSFVNNVSSLALGNSLPLPDEMQAIRVETITSSLALSVLVILLMSMSRRERERRDVPHRGTNRTI